MAELRVLHLIEHLDIGGAERLTADICMSLVRHNAGADKIHPHVLLYRRRGAFADEIEDNGVPVYFLRKALCRKSNAIWSKIVHTCLLPIEGLVFTIRLARFIRQNRISVVHTHMFSAGLWARLATFFGSQAPVILTEHTVRTGTESLKRRFLGRLLRSKAAAFVAVSEGVASSLCETLKLPNSAVQVIPNGVPVSLFLARKPQESGPLRLIAVGRLVPVKRFDVLLQALQMLLHKGVAFSCSIVGDGPLRDDLHELAQALSLQKHVMFEGERLDVRQMLSNMDVLVNTSDREGLPISLLEAYAAQCAVIATRVGGTPEIVHHEETGILIPTDGAHELSAALETLAKERGKLTEMARAGHRLVSSHYSLDDSVKMWKTLYQKLAEKHAP